MIKPYFETHTRVGTGITMTTASADPHIGTDGRKGNTTKASRDFIICTFA